MSGQIHIDVFLTLDGVGQGPGGPDEDRDGGFPFGGWQAPYADAATGARIMRGIESMDALLLGRRTYDIFAGYWPQHAENPIGRIFNALPKYVATHRDAPLAWAHSTRLGDDVPTAVAALRDRHREVHVVGSLDFAQTLLREGLFDRLNLWTYPVVLGVGKRLFPEGVTPVALTPAEEPLVAENGTVFASYAPAGRPRTGTIDDG